jgi:rod shape-determining protein MreD
VKNFIFLLILFIIVLIQATLMHYLRFFGVKPDLLICFIVVTSVYFEWKWALSFSLLAGLFKDLLGSSGLGINIFLMPLWGYLVLRLSRKISIDDPIGLSATVFLAVLLNDIASRFLYLSFGKYVSLGIFLRIAFIEALYTTALALPIFLGTFDYIKKIPDQRSGSPDFNKTDL